MTTHTRLMLVLGFAGTLACSALAQPGGEPARPAPKAGEQTPEGELSENARREAARQLIERRLNELKQQEAELREGLDMLDRGEPLDKVRAKTLDRRMDRLRELRDAGPGGERPMRDGMRPGGGQGPGPGMGSGPGRRGGELDRPERGEGPRGDMRGEGPEDGRRRDAEPLNDQERQQALNFIRLQAPETVEDAERLMHDDPAKFDGMVQRRLPRFAQWIHEGRQDPEMFKLRREFFELEMTSRKAAREAAENENNTDARKRLMEALDRQFDLRTSIDEREVSRLRERIDKLDKQRAQQAEQRKQIVERRANQMIERAREGKPQWERGDRPPRGEGPPPPPDERPLD